MKVCNRAGTAKPGLFILLSLLILISLPLHAFASSESASSSKVTVGAERLSYDSVRKILHLEGNVEVKHEDIIIRSEKAVIDLENNLAEFLGGVNLSFKNDTVGAEHLLYDMKKSEYKVTDASMTVTSEELKGPAYLYGTKVEGSDSFLIIDDGRFTTCDLKEPHYHVKAGHIEIYFDDKIILKNLSYWEGSIPIFWWPYFYISLKESDTGFDLPTVGYDYYKGWYVKNSYRYSNSLLGNGKILFDYYELVGFGFGIDHKYSFPRLGEGNLLLYNLGDYTTPGSEIDAILEHSFNFSPDFSVKGKGGYEYEADYLGRPNSRISVLLSAEKGITTKIGGYYQNVWGVKEIDYRETDYRKESGKLELSQRLGDYHIWGEVYVADGFDGTERVLVSGERPSFEEYYKFTLGKGGFSPFLTLSSRVYSGIKPGTATDEDREFENVEKSLSLKFRSDLHRKYDFISRLTGGFVDSLSVSSDVERIEKSYSLRPDDSVSAFNYLLSAKMGLKQLLRIDASLEERHNLPTEEEDYELLDPEKVENTGGTGLQEGTGKEDGDAGGDEDKDEGEEPAGGESGEGQEEEAPYPGDEDEYSEEWIKYTRPKIGIYLNPIRFGRFSFSTGADYSRPVELRSTPEGDIVEYTGDAYGVQAGLNLTNQKFWNIFTLNASSTYRYDFSRAVGADESQRNSANSISSNVSITANPVQWLRLRGTYNYSNMWGSTPFNFMWRNHSERIYLRGDAGQNGWSLQVDTSYDILGKTWDNIYTTFRYSQGKNNSFGLQSVNDPYTFSPIYLRGYATMKSDKERYLNSEVQFDFTDESIYLRKLQLEANIRVSRSLLVGSRAIFGRYTYQELPELKSAEINLTFDLHCRELTLGYDHLRKEFRVAYRINAFPRGSLRMGVGEGGIDINTDELIDLLTNY